jgi:methylphosphotriester-DNA--protein-cysteine methyltransferase
MPQLPASQLVDGALNLPEAMGHSFCSVQRRFLSATGLTHRAIYQIERARYATLLLKQGVSILDTVLAAGFADQPHMTRSFKRLIGQTPAQVIDQCNSQQLSYLFNTDTLAVSGN